eukprot:8949-Eustigmatos_ZCMA.PRE.1
MVTTSQQRQEVLWVALFINLTQAPTGWLTLLCARLLIALTAPAHRGHMWGNSESVLTVSQKNQQRAHF